MKYAARKLKLAALLSMSLTITGAWADQSANTSPGSPVDDGPAVPAANTLNSALGDAIPDQALSGERGKALVTNLNDLNGSVYQNSADNAVTGNNFVTNGSFNGNNGASTVIQNSGNNVLIQNALILNVQVP